MKRSEDELKMVGPIDEDEDILNNSSYCMAYVRRKLAD
jgi:hypothetical protein